MFHNNNNKERNDVESSKMGALNVCFTVFANCFTAIIKMINKPKSLFAVHGHGRLRNGCNNGFGKMLKVDLIFWV